MFVLLLAQFVAAQQPVISARYENKPLNAVLAELSEKYQVKFAYDADSFQEIEVSFDIQHIPLNDFLQMLKSDYQVKSKFIDGTWVLVAAKPAVSERTKSKPEKPPVVTISGYVKDKFSGENLLYCNVAVGETGGGITNELGFFSITISKTDSVRMRISHLGYQPLDTIVAVNKTLIIELQPSKFEVETIEVKRYGKQVLQASPHPGKMAFNPVKSSNVPRLSNDDLANALLIIPGVNFIQGSAAGISIRGSSPTDNLILFDGIPVLETSHLLGNMSVLNSKFVQQAFVSRGGFDAEYGGRVAGLIQLVGKSGKNKNPYLEVGANLLNTNVLANLPLGEKFSVTAAWRRSLIDQWENYLYFRLVDEITSESEAANPITSSIYPVIQYEDLNAKLSFHPSDNLEFNLNFLYGRDNQNRDFALLQSTDYFRNEYVESETKGFGLNWNWQVNNRWFHALTAGYSRLEKNSADETGELKEVTETVENPGQGKGKGKGLLKTKEKTYEKLVQDIDNGYNEVEEYRANWKTGFKSGAIDNNAGIGWTANKFQYNFYANRSEAFVPVDSIVNSESLYLMNAFLQQKITAGKFNFRWGLHLNTDLTIGKVYWQPRGGIEYNPAEGLQLHFLSGVYNQFLSGVKRIDSEGQYNRIWYLSKNSGEGVVSAVHYIFGAEYDKNGWFANVEAYLKNTEGKMYLFAEPVNAGNEWVISYFQRVTAERNAGVDFFLQKKHNIFNHMVGYSISKSEEKINGILNDNWYPAYNDRTHRFKLTEMVTWKNWTLTGSWHYATGLPVINLNESGSFQAPERTLTFSQLNLALAKKITNQHFSAEAGASLLNVLDRENIVEVNYLRFASGQESLSVRSDISALALTPVFFVNFIIH